MLKRTSLIALLLIMVAGLFASPADARRTSPVTGVYACVYYGNTYPLRVEFVVTTKRVRYLKINRRRQRVVHGGGYFIQKKNYRNSRARPRLGSRVRVRVKSIDSRKRRFAKTYRVKVRYCEG